MKGFLNVLPVVLAIGCSFAVVSAQATTISSGLGINTTTRICPYATNEMECIAQSYDPYPNEIIAEEVVVNNATFVALESYSSWATASLDPDLFFLPEVHFYAEGDLQERASSNVAAYQQFEWTGASDTLTFTTSFDFTMSAGEWDGDTDSYFFSNLVLFETLESHIGFAPQWSNELGAAMYHSDDYAIGSGELVEESLSLSLAVNPGDTFYVMAIVQGGGMNGGWVDSSNSLLSSVSAVNTPFEALSQSLQAVTAVQVHEPGTFGMFMAVSLILVIRRMNK